MRVSFGRGYSDTNHHGTEKKGEPWNRETRKGWTVCIVKLENFLILQNGCEALQSLAGRRLIVYAPSGAWWHFDVCLTPARKEVQVHAE